jgi:hypothetical protein
LILFEKHRGTPPPVFFAKSAESLEKKRVGFLLHAKKLKRVRKNMKAKGIGQKHRLVGRFGDWKVERTG